MELLEAVPLCPGGHCGLFHHAPGALFRVRYSVLRSGPCYDHRVIVRTLVFGDPTSGWPSLVCIMLLLSGIQMLGIGVVGQYLAKTYLETKHRPIYLARLTNIEKKPKKEEA